ncbi:MAG: histidinol-phosphate transaminase [Micrococcales bacterium]|nr:histidinol-phosphate transaminase [Micrococcales bacterium]
MTVILRPEIATLPPYRQGKQASPGSFKLSSNENPAAPHPAIVEAIGASSWNRYPDASATLLREALAQRHGVTIDEVHVGAGSVALLHQFIQAAAGPGDEVVYAWRSFEAYPGIVTIAGAQSARVPLRVGGRHDPEAMLAAISGRTRVVLVCTPNNPTGPIVTEEEFAGFMARVPDTVLVILDEAYREFVDRPDAVDGVPLLERHPNLVVLRTFSKAYGLAGLRVGYAIGAPYLLDAARAAQISLSMTEPAQRAALAALEHEAEILVGVQELRERRARVVAALAEQGWRIPDAQGNFVWLPTGERTAQAEAVLERHGIVARVFAPEGIRVSIGEEESVAPLLTAAAELVETLHLGSEAHG